ncbi:F5/8 type C domain [Seminavis robusta]|uniref:F5/8 type C domain n=1 Tax=Seminavis robusta TaxID=568900 RepID=A0A9N8D583_9STRA|nr:F5/8 type C domain [Seminavis robusta]|eukprot:Sro7_g005970.1 F5/8 type C domain (1225) ;mRNA; f:106670-110613
MSPMKKGMKRNHRTGSTAGNRGRPTITTTTSLLFVLLLRSSRLFFVQADICFLLYQNADNLLETGMRKSLKQWINSDAIRDPTVTTWVYFDALNNVKGVRKDTPDIKVPTTPLEDVWTKDGSQLLTDESKVKFTGSYYMSFDHEDQKMKVYKEVREEQDSDDPGTLWGFVGYSMERCLGRGANETFLILNGYGEGSNGFGGDDNKQRRQRQRRRRLVPEVTEPEPDETQDPPIETDQTEGGGGGTHDSQPVQVESHEDVVMALRQVLHDLHGGPAKFSVLGFDAHFMQTFRSVNEYKSITKHMLASQSLMPEHGLAYETLTETSTAKALAQQMVSEFVSQPQSDNGHHSTPKTLSLIDTGLPFTTFLNATNAFLGAMTELIKNPNTMDAHFFAHLHRARSQAVTYAKDCAIDLGSFLYQLADLCDPEPDSDLAVLANNLNDAYRHLFVARDFGPGTVEGTGLLIDFPTVHEYNKDPTFWEDSLFLTNDQTVREENPKYVEFFQAYVSATQRDDRQAMTTESVCRIQAAGTFVETASSGVTIFVQPLSSVSDMSRSFVVGGIDKEDAMMTNPGVDGLFVDPQVASNPSTGHVEVKTGLQMLATTVDAFYGVNVTNLMDDYKGAHQPHDQRMLRRNLGSEHPVNNDEFIILYGGKAPGDFVSTQNTMEWKATWDRQFYVLNDGSGEHFHMIFVKEPEEPGTFDAKQVEVVYFPDYNTKIREEMSVRSGTPVASAVPHMGGSKGYLEIRTDPTTGKDSFTLYETYCKMAILGHENCNVRQPIGGFVAPVIPVRGRVHGHILRDIVGGPSGKVIAWDTVDGWSLDAMSQTEFQEAIKAGSVVMELEASSSDEVKTDLRSFDVTATDDGRVEKILTEQPTGSPTTTPATPSPTTLRPTGFPTTLPPEIPPAEPDVARCKPAIQSSTLEGNVARQALTGDINILSHTQCEMHPWWMVDLFSYRPISSVIVHNRQDCCTDRLSGVVVELLDENDKGIAFVQHNPDTEGPIESSWTAQFEGQEARKVRVSIERLDECEFLNLASVQVFSDSCTEKDSCSHIGGGCDYGNVALCKPATQSTSFVADPANDPTGSENGAWRATDGTPTLSHTDCEEAPWWELDLLSERIVTEIVIKNREDCCFERLNGLTVELTNQFNQLTGLYQHDPATGAIKPMLIVHFDSVETRKVRLSLKRGPNDLCGFLNLEEVQVYSDCIPGDACQTETGCPQVAIAT